MSDHTAERPDEATLDEVTLDEEPRVNRRAWFSAAGVIGATGLLAACQPAAPAPTTAPPRTTTTTRPPATLAPTTTAAPATTAPTTTTTAPPTTAPATTAPPTTAPPTTAPSGTMLPAWPSTWPSADVWHVAKRLTYGPTPEVVADIEQRGITGWIDWQLDHTGIDDTVALDATTVFRNSHGTAAQVAAGAEPWFVPVDLGAATVVRAITSRRQLYERVVAHWWDNLNVDSNSTPAQNHCPAYDRDVIRSHALGRFSDLLLASATSGAMLNYLDQATSRADNGRVPNQNYARELMELHTVGVDGGYTEADVEAVSHLLSGWGLSHNATGTFTFRSSWHHLGPFSAPDREVLGWSRGSLTGQAAGVSFIHHLARHPATARRLAHRLAVRFIGEHVADTSDVVTAAANVYLANDTAIAPTLRTILTHPAFAAAPDLRIRRPVELCAAAMRALGTTDFDGSKPADTKWGLQWILGPVAHLPHRWAPPNGFPDRDAHWVSVGPLIGRWNLLIYINSGSMPGFAADWAAVAAWTPGSTVGDWLDAASRRLGVPLDDTGRSRLLSAVHAGPTRQLRVPDDTWMVSRLLTLLMQQPRFQTL